VSANVLMAMNLSKQDLMPPEKAEESEEEDIPAWLTEEEGDKENEKETT